MTEQRTHPTPEKLNAFSLGQLPPEDAEAVEGHISECQPCCETLMGFSSDDTFVALLKEANRPPTDETLDQLADVHAPTAAGEIPAALVDHPRYAIVAPVGKGGMGDVFKAEHRLMERTVALKVIKRELFRNPAAVQRFHREVKSAARLSHPNIVTAHDAEQAGDVNFLVMEYVEGVDLARRVREQGALPIHEACRYILQTALGLQHAHEQGMVHRDIKPHNLMVTSDGTLKILDFGLATLATEAITSEVSDEVPEGAPENWPTSRLTTMGTMMGTPDFISPEQAGQPHAVDIRSDVYSLGCTFYYLLAGRPPFAEGSVIEKVKAHTDQQVEPIENVRADILEEVADVVRRMLAKDPAERFQTPAEVADALAPFVDAHRTIPASPEKSDSAARTAASRRSWWPPTIAQALGFAAFAVVLGVIITIATDRGTLEIRSPDEGVEIAIRPVRSGAEDADADASGAEFDITDTLTGSSVKWLRSGEYVLDIKGNENDYELSQKRFVLKRGETVIVTVTKKDAPIPDLELLPESWVDGESLQFNISLANGLDIGTFVFGISSSQEDGKDIWQSNVGRYIRMNAPNQGISRVKADRNTFRPISSLFRHSILGHFEATYGSDEVKITIANRDDGKPSIRRAKTGGTYYDNEQSMLLFRRLPLAKGYKTTLPVFATFADGPIEVEVEVAAQEMIDVPAGEFECYRLFMPKLQQTYWISTDEHRYPIKFEADGVVGVLAAVRVNRPGEKIEYRNDEFGYSLATPSDWYFVKWEQEDDVREVYLLLDPEAEAFSVQRARPTELLTDHGVESSRALADMRVKRRNELLKDFKVRPDSWTDRTISGHPGISFIADYVARRKQMVQYYVCSLGESTAVEFFTDIEQDKFDDFQGSFDAIIDTYREKQE